MEEPLFRTITNLRKSGKLQEAWDLGCPAVQENPSDRYLRGAFFWVCYEHLKQVQAAIKEKAQQNNGNFTPNAGQLDRINFLIEWVMWLKLPPGGIEYRSLFLVFQKNLESIPKLVILLAQFSDSLFEDEDRQPYKGDKGESPSLILKFARKVAKAWMEHEEVRQISIERLMQIFEQARSQGKDTQHLIWLDYDEAKCLIMSGRFEEAREFVIPVLRKKQTESWAWGALAATYRKEEPDIAIQLFCKGLTHAHDEKFSLKLLKGLAPLLAATGDTAEASMCVKRAIDCYERNGWKIRQDLEQLTQLPWFNRDVNPDELSPYLEQRAEGALDLLHGPSEQCVAIISHIHRSGKGFHAYRDQKRSYSVRLGLYKGKGKPKAGTYVHLTLAVDDGSVIAAKPAEPAELSGVASDSGELRVAPKGFGFVNGTFVPPYLVRDGMDGKAVNIVKVLDFDETKSRPSWKAITLEFG